MQNSFHIFQVGAFVGYASKFSIENKKALWSLFNNWAASKDFLEEDRDIILKLTREYYRRKTEEAELKKSRRDRQRKSKIDTNQSEFDFLK